MSFSKLTFDLKDPVDEVRGRVRIAWLDLLFKQSKNRSRCVYKDLTQYIFTFAALNSSAFLNSLHVAIYIVNRVQFCTLYIYIPTRSKRKCFREN